MLKTIGLLLLIAAFGIIGKLKSDELKQRIMLLEDYKKMILETKSRINYFRQPFLNINTQETQNGDLKAFSLLDSLRIDIEEKEWEISKIWSENINVMYRHTSLNNEDIAVMEYLGSFIGQTDYENQISHFEYLESRLEKQIASASENYKIRGPLYIRLGFLFGLLLALVLI